MTKRRMRNLYLSRRGSMAAVAKELGLARQTISLFLKGQREISATNARKIEEYATKLREAKNA